MDALRDAILLNNHGVHQLDCGNLDEALNSFQYSVLSVKVAIALSSPNNNNVHLTLLGHHHPPPPPTTTASRFPPKPNSNNNHINYNTNETSPSSSPYQVSYKPPTPVAAVAVVSVVPPPPPSPVVLPAMRCGSLLDGLNNGICYIYNRPLLLPTDITILTMEHLNSVVVTASTYIIFNFAMTCHVVARHTGKECYFIRAMRLYELTLKVLDTAARQQRQSIGNNNYYFYHRHEMHAVLECLALNNLAQMHHEQCNYQLSQSFMDTMYELLTTIDHLDTYLNEKELEEIMLNLVYLQSPSVAKAA